MSTEPPIRIHVEGGRAEAERFARWLRSMGFPNVEMIDRGVRVTPPKEPTMHESNETQPGAEPSGEASDTVHEVGELTLDEYTMDVDAFERPKGGGE